jgi:site-specific recombinase XerD
MELPLLEQFLAVYSKKCQKMNRDKLTDFAQVMDTLQITDISQIKKTHIEEYLMNCLEQKPLAIATKKHYYCTIKVYFKFLFENEKIPQIPPFSTRVKFTEQVNVERMEKKSRPLPDEDDILKLLTLAQNENPRMYLYLMLSVHNGARDSEIRSILLKNIRHLTISLKEHGITTKYDFWVIVSGQIEGHRKTGACYYFIPPGLVESFDWKLYIRELEMKYPNPTYLFQTDTNKFMCYKIVWDNLDAYATKLKLKCRVNPHIFRDVINELRMDEGCGEPILSILLNQSCRGTNAKYYTKKCENPAYRYKFWLKFTPIFFPGKQITIKESAKEEIILAIDSQLKATLIKQAEEAGLSLKNYIIEKLSE